MVPERLAEGAGRRCVPSPVVLSLARWCSDHRRVVVILWILVVVGATAAWQSAGSAYSNNFSLGDTGSQHAIDLLKSRFPAQSGDRDQIVFRADSGVTSPAVQTRIAQMLDQVSKLPHVSQVVSPYSPAGRAQISRDGKIAFANVVFDKRSDLLPLSAIKKVISTAQDARAPGLQVELGGQAIQQAEVAPPGSLTGIGVLAAVVVLLISFGSFLAMGLPIVTALFGLGTGAALIGLGTHVIDMADFSLELAAMIGLGVGIDYSLFILTRYREIYSENGGDVREAVLLAMDTSGRAVLFAGATVMIALLRLFGHKVGQPGRIARRIARRRERRQRPARPRFWARWIGGIQRHPWAATIGATAFMLLLCAPALALRLGSSDAGNNPTSFTSRQAYDLNAKGFGAGVNGPLTIVADLQGANKAQALAQLTAALKRTPDVVTVTP